MERDRRLTAPRAGCGLIFKRNNLVAQFLERFLYCQCLFFFFFPFSFNFGRVDAPKQRGSLGSLLRWTD